MPFGTNSNDKLNIINVYVYYYILLILCGIEKNLTSKINIVKQVI